ncbi:MAG TPA: ATP-binding cassette domain-containing protein [Caulobacteraceae bacterium]
MLQVTTAADQKADSQPRPVVLRAQGLCKAFEGNVVLDEVAFDLRRGEVVLLEGENGSGKTTLLNILSGFLAPDAGAVEYLVGNAQRFSFGRKGQSAGFSPMSAARGGVGRAWQEVRLFGSLTLRENVAVAVQNQLGERPWSFVDPRTWMRERTIRRAADGWLERLGLAGRALSLANAVSLGQSLRMGRP